MLQSVGRLTLESPRLLLTLDEVDRTTSLPPFNIQWSGPWSKRCGEDLEPPSKHASPPDG